MDEPTVSKPWMGNLKTFRLNWVHVTVLGFVLLMGSAAWFYFREWPYIKDAPEFLDYYPSLGRRLITLSGLAMFLGGLIFGIGRATYKLARRLLSR